MGWWLVVMEAERIAKSLTIYHQKYRASIAKRQSVSLAANLASTSAAEATQNGQHKNGGLQNGGGGPERKISSELFRKVRLFSGFSSSGATGEQCLISKHYCSVLIEPGLTF